jgi:uncharacterized protein with von Willebrand factor type A (vWA) domain
VTARPLTGAPVATRIVDELFWTLRRAGLPIATSQAIDAARAVTLLGFASKETLRDALAAIIVQRQVHTKRFVRAFDEHFALALGGARTFWERLARDFSAEETILLRELLEAHGAASAASSDAGFAAVNGEEERASPLVSLLTGTDSELGQLLVAAEIRRVLEPMKSRQQVGFFGQRVLQAAGLNEARTALAGLRRQLIDTLGAIRGAALADALHGELDRVQAILRAHVGAPPTSARRPAPTENAGSRPPTSPRSRPPRCRRCVSRCAASWRSSPAASACAGAGRAPGRSIRGGPCGAPLPPAASPWCSRGRSAPAASLG